MKLEISLLLTSAESCLTGSEVREAGARPSVITGLHGGKVWLSRSLLLDLRLALGTGEDANV